MEYSLIEFQSGVSKLKKFIEGISNNRALFIKINNIENPDPSPEGELLLEAKEYLTYYFDTDIKIFEYTSIIINLYGLLEKYIESIISEYIDSLINSIPKYNDLPKEIINHHFELSAQLINSLSLPKYKDRITKEKIISNLYSCANCTGEKKYRINNDAFTQHSYNFRENSINDFFKTTGISNMTSLLKQNKIFRGYIDEEGIPTENYFDTLNDLAERRNRISHGSEEDDILGIAELSRYIKYIDIFVQSLNSIVIEQSIPYIIDKGDNIEIIGNPIAEITDRIIGIKVSNMKLAVGDKIFIKKDEENFSYGKIQSMEINNESYEKLELTNEDYEIAIKCDCKVRASYFLYKVT